MGAHREAAELYQLALRYAGTTPARKQVIWLEQQAFERYLCADLQTAATCWREAIARRHVLGDRLEEGDDLRWLSHVLYPLGRTTEAIEAGLASLRLLHNLGPSRQLAWSLVTLAGLSTYTYDPRAAEYADWAVTLGTQLGETAVVFRAQSYAGLATVFRTDAGWDDLEAAWRATMRSAALAEHAGFIGMNLSWTAAVHRDLDRAASYIAETVPFCIDHDMGTFQMLAVGADALVGLHRGTWDHAAMLAYQVLSRPEMSPLHRILPLVTVALIRARRGQQPVAPLLDEAITSYEPGGMLHLGTVWAARAEVAWLAGDDDAARAEAYAGLAAATEHTDPWLVGHLRRWVHLAGGSTESTGGAMTPFESEISGDWQAAAEAWRARGCSYDAALAQLGGDVAAVGSALATFRRLGARAAARRAQQRLAALRGRTPRSRRADTLADPDGLSRRQREVLELIAAGDSDAEIAAKLSLSPKTVGHHVSSILAKLNVDNRIQAAAHRRHAPVVEPLAGDTA
ncbi:MAG TPA: helix-turn-helix transcriptional regulator [Mycobacterium sp.]